MNVHCMSVALLHGPASESLVGFARRGEFAMDRQTVEDRAERTLGIQEGYVDTARRAGMDLKELCLSMSDGRWPDL